MSDFKKIMRDGKSVCQKSVYVTFGTRCQCNCEGCRNKSFDSEVMKMDRKRLIPNIIKEAGEFRHIIFGGGEPLFELTDIMYVIENIKYNNTLLTDDDEIKFSLVTNGERQLFHMRIDRKCVICNCFRQIILSRYHYDDIANEIIFKTRTPLMRTEDLKNICPSLKEKIQLSCLCQKGGIDSPEEIKRYLKWAAELEITHVMFSNFQDEVTEEKSNICDLSLLWEAQDMLVKELGFEKEPAILFSAGYKITNCTGMIHIEIEEVQGRIVNIFGGWLPILSEIKGRVIVQRKMTVSFREFLPKEEWQKEWKSANRRTYNYSIMPNGSMYKDWVCNDKIDI